MFCSSMESESKTLTSPAPMDHLVLFSSSVISPLLHRSKSPSPLSILLLLLRRLLLLCLRLLILLLPSRAASWAPHHPPSPSPSPSPGPTPAERALSHVLSVVSRVPVASRKYELVRTLADRLLDDNLTFSRPSINIPPLSSAFCQTIRRLELAVQPPAEGGPVEMVISAVRCGVRRWGDVARREVTGKAGGGDGRMEAEKMAAEVVWLAGKMAECGAVEEAVRTWGDAAGLARVALAAEPRIQVAFVRVSAFLFKHANAKQFGRKGDGEEEEGEDDKESIISRYRMAMLTSWLPLLCRASNGTGAPTLSSGERAEMVKVLEEMIEKLSWEKQEEVLALWLHHFTSCPDSNWPNLEACYTRWYSKSRDLLLKRLD